MVVDRLREIFVNGRLVNYTTPAELELILRREKRCAERKNSPGGPKPKPKQRLA